MPICLVALLALNFQGTNARPNFPITGDLEQAAEVTKRAWQHHREVDGRTAAAALPVVLVVLVPAKCEGEQATVWPGPGTSWPGGRLFAHQHAHRGLKPARPEEDR